MLATYAFALDQINRLSGLPVDTAGNLYVADTGNYPVQIYTPGP